MALSIATLGAMIEGLRGTNSIMFKSSLGTNKGLYNSPTFSDYVLYSDTGVQIDLSAPITQSIATTSAGETISDILLYEETGTSKIYATFDVTTPREFLTGGSITLPQFILRLINNT